MTTSQIARPAPAPNVDRTSQRWVLGLTATAAFIVALDQLVVATALSTMQRDLHASLATLGWTVNAYSLSFAILLISGAALGDRFGRRRLFAIGLGIFGLASAACALAPTAGWLITARAVQGAGSALIMPLALALLTAAYPPHERGRAMGIFTALTGLAVAGGPVVGGAVTEGLDWPWIFWINVPIAAAAIPLVLTRVPESRGTPGRPDIIGVALAGLAMFGLVWGLVRAGAAGWLSAEVTGALAAGAVLMGVFVLWEQRTSEPMLPPSLFRIRAFTAGNVAIFLLTASVLSTVFFIAQYLQVAQGNGPLGAGLRFLPWTVTLFVVAPLAGSLSDRIGSRPLITGGLALQAAGLAWLAANVDGDRPYAANVLALVVAGCGTSAALPAVQSQVMGSVPPAAMGKASGAFNTMRQLGAAFGVAVLSAVFAVRGSFASPEAFTDGVAPAVGVAAGLALLGAGAGLFSGEPRRGHGD